MKLLAQKFIVVLPYLLLLGSPSATAQKEAKTKSVFVRVYDLEGNKVNKGDIIFVNDSVLGLKDGYTTAHIKVQSIGKIRTKRSAGHNVLLGATAGAGIGAILGVSTADPDSWVLSHTAGEGATAMGSLGAIGGAAIGGVTSALKKSETFIIDGEFRKWKIFMEMIEKTSFH